MADAERAPDEGWLVLIYRVPSEPSRLRSAVWRQAEEPGRYLPAELRRGAAGQRRQRAGAAQAAQPDPRHGGHRGAAVLPRAGGRAGGAGGVPGGAERRVRGDRRPLRGLPGPGEEGVRGRATSPTPSWRRTRSTWSSCGPGSPGSARGTRSARPAAPRRRRPWRPASSRSTTTRPGCTRRRRTATDRPGRYPRATVHLLARRPASHRRPSCIPADTPITSTQLA